MSQPHLSLLSLSIAAANAAPIPASPIAESAQPRSSQGLTTNTTKHRRLSSASRSRRRHSDARDAATRPFPTSLQTASASLAALSLSSPAVSHRSVHAPHPIQVPRTVSIKNTSALEPASVDDSHLSISPPQSYTPLPSINGIKSGRKRGTTFTCESCSKVYRHPSCLIKHRWEHTPQWREASKFVLSKHQQVQLLEAAAILSHLSPSSASLPEDRSLWPSFLSGGLVPPPASVPSSGVEPAPTTIADPRITLASGVHSTSPISSSVPASSVLSSESPGPRLHDHPIGGDVTQVLPGVLGMPTAPMRVPAQHSTTLTNEDDALNLLALRSASVTSGSCGSSASASKPFSSSSHSRAHSHSHSLSAPHVWKERERRRSNAYEYGFVSGSAAYSHASHSNGGWALPRSSVRSKSGSSGSRSRSQSASESQSDDEDESVLQDEVHPHREVYSDDGMVRPRVYGSRVRAWKTEDGDDGVTGFSVREDEQEVVEDDKSVMRSPAQTWEGMEMEMEMEMEMD